MAYTIAEFKEALGQVELQGTHSVYLTSRMMGLGFLDDGDTKKEKLTLLYNAIRERVGEETTITCSTANWSEINISYVFDHENQPSREGALTEYIRKLPGALRSIHPFVNYSSIGPLAKQITENVSPHDFGPDSVFDRLMALDTVQVQLGFNPTRALTLLHHAEFIRAVPYRYHKEFPFTVKTNQGTYEQRFYTNARFLSSEIKQDYSRTNLFNTFHAMGYKIGEATVGAGSIYYYKWSEMYKALTEVLRKDPYGLLENPPEIRMYATTM